MQEARVIKSVMLSRCSELLALRDFGIGVRFNEIQGAVGREAKVDARVSIEPQCSVDAFCCSQNAGAYLRRKVGRPIYNSHALLISGIVFDLLGGYGLAAHGTEFQFPNRQHSQPIITEHADIKLTSRDILLGDRGGSDPLVDEGDALCELLVRIDDGCLRDTPGSILVQALDDQRQRKTRWAFDLSAHREYGEGRHRDPAMVHQRLGQILAARQDQTTRVTSGIRDQHQFEIACDVLIIRGLVVKLFQQREYHVRLETFDLLAHRLDFLLRTERANIMAGRTQGAHDVVFCFPFVDLPRSVSVGGIRGHEVRMHEHQNAQASHSAIHFRREGPNRACMVLAVNSTVKSATSFRSEPTARRLSSRQRAIMSSSTALRVSWFSPVHRATSCLMWARCRLMNAEAGCPRRCRGSEENSRERSRS